MAEGQKQVDLPAVVIRVGSKRDNELVFQRPTVSGYHARIFQEEKTDRWMLEDLGSTNGTYLRGAKLVPGSPVEVKAGDLVFLGKTFHFTVSEEILSRARPFDQGEIKRLEHTPPGESAPTPLAELELPLVPDLPATPPGGRVTVPGRQGPLLSPLSRPRPVPWSGAPSPTEETLVGREGVELTLELPPEVLSRVSEEGRSRLAGGSPRLQATPPPPPDAPSISIGYADDNTVQLKNPVVSGHHARLYRVEDHYVLEDQGSTNGTWVGGERITRLWVTADDQFSVGNDTLRVSDLLRYFSEKPQDSWALPAPAIPALDRPIRIGRNPECDIRLDAPMVSGFHASLVPISHGRYRVEDLGSTNGTFVNSRENRVTTATVGSQDVLFLGSYRLPVSRLESLIAQVTGEYEVVIPPEKEVMLIGRDESCDIVLSSPQVSRTHAELRRLSDGTFEVRDLGSINGTFINGQRIKTRVISPVDLLSFANYRMRLDVSAGVVRRDYHGDIMLQAERVTVRVRDRSSPEGYKTLLADVSFTVYPTEFVGLMGPSGAGKTTLMMALNGYTLPTAGRSLINGYDLYSNYNSFRGAIGYVPQDDIIYHELTVFESLYFTAKLRLPPDTTDAEIRGKIEDLLEKLEISNTREVIIGDALKKGISGGERKRVNLAQELITEPSLLFLDEPTSGLASQDAINVMNLLRRLANEGRTILLTIHQPSLEAYRKLDNVIYLFHGRMVYYGPAYPDGISFFFPEVDLGTPEGHLLLSDPGNALKALAEDQKRSNERSDPEQALTLALKQRCSDYLGSMQFKDYVHDRSVAPRDRVRLGEGSKQKTERRGWLRQWGILTRRCLTIKRKDVVNTAILLLQAPVIGVVLWLVFAGRMTSPFQRLEHGPSALFLLVMSAVWFGCSNSAREIVKEQAIYRRERMVNLIIGSYVLSKFTVLGALCALQCAILLGMVYPALGYEGCFLVHYLVLFLVSLCGVGIGLTLSAMVRSAEAATALVPLLLIPQIMLGGILIPTHDLNLPMGILSNAMVARWGYEGVLHVEYGKDDLDAIRQQCGIDACPDPLGAKESSPVEDTAGPRLLTTLFGQMEERSYLPRGVGEETDICTILCTNTRRGAELTPLERAFGLDLDREGSLRHRYHQEYGVGVQGVQVGLPVVLLVLFFLNALLFGLVCSILRLKDVEVG
ncbi:MAG: FHA domain-containing protein [Bradymonadales bacterium]|nr:FHA domain-containing protein [Bradymonadales bacterium]